VRHTRRLALLAALTTLTGGLASVGGAGTAWAADAAFGVGTPTFTSTDNPDTSSYAGEPSLGIDQTTGAGMFMSGTNVFRLAFDNSSGATTWTDATPPGSVANLDPILATDPKTGTTLAGGDTGPCSELFRSTDDGTSWTPALPCTFTTDHPTVSWAPSATSPGDRVWYYCQQQTYQSCSTSTDGGSTWLPGVPMTALDCEHFHGHLRGSADGTAYLPSYTCFDANVDQRVGGVLTRDDGATWQGYTIPTATQTSSNFDPAVGTTPDNTVYQAWSDAAYQPMIARSTDHGATWSPSVNLSDWATSRFTATTFPTLTTGDNGRVAYTFVGTSTPVPTGQSPFSPGFRGVWYLYTAFTYDAGRTWSVVRDRSTPIQVGEIDAGGTTSSLSQRNLEDFIDSSVTKDGRVVVAFADGCLATCQADLTAGDLSKATTDSTDGVGAVSYQTTGLGLLSAYDGSGGTVTPGPTGTPCPGGRGGFADPPGDATEVLVTGETPLPSDPALDLLDGSVGWDSATSTAVFRLRVTDLAATPLAGQQSFRWLVSFSDDTKTYTLGALRGATGAPTFRLSTTSTDAVAIAGSFDNASNTVTMLLPSAFFQTFKAGNTALTGTRSVTVSQVFGDRTIDGLVVTSSSAADTAATTCNGTLAPPVTPPAAPVLSGGASGPSVSLSWTTPANGGSPISGYQVLRAPGTGPLVQLGTTTGTSFTDSTGTPGQTYSYAVTATNAVGTSPQSNLVQATPVTTPGAAALTATGALNSANLSWTTPSTGGSAITGYVVERGTVAGVRSTLGTVGAGSTSYSDTTAVAGTTYYYAVRAVNAVGTGPASNEAAATPYTTAGASTLTATSGVKGQVPLSWTVPANGGQPIQGYRIYRGTAAGGEVLIQTISTGTSYVDAAVTGGTKYWYRVAAYTSAGDGALSNEVSATPKRG